MVIIRIHANQWYELLRVGRNKNITACCLRKRKSLSPLFGKFTKKQYNNKPQRFKPLMLTIYKVTQVQQAEGFNEPRQATPAKNTGFAWGEAFCLRDCGHTRQAKVPGRHGLPSSPRAACRRPQHQPVCVLHSHFLWSTVESFSRLCGKFCVMKSETVFERERSDMLQIINHDYGVWQQ